MILTNSYSSSFSSDSSSRSIVPVVFSSTFASIEIPLGNATAGSETTILDYTIPTGRGGLWAFGFTAAARTSELKVGLQAGSNWGHLIGYAGSLILSKCRWEYQYATSSNGSWNTNWRFFTINGMWVANVSEGQHIKIMHYRGAVSWGGLVSPSGMALPTVWAKQLI